ncbi:MAG TPA: hypothetical protein VLB02_00710 [Candidatus Paceibacterota bacterium]|nr:hypothetical protein [Candidatus Paceibacterota bacterium]
MSKILATVTVFIGIFILSATPVAAQYYQNQNYGYGYVHDYGYNTQPCCLSYAWQDPYVTSQYRPMYLPPQQPIYTGGWNEPYYYNQNYILPNRYSYGSNYGFGYQPYDNYNNRGWDRGYVTLGFGW